MDVAAIAAAIAVRFAAAAITPPAGYDDIALSTSSLPSAITTTPTVLVFPPAGQWTWSAGASRVGDLAFPVRFYVATTSDMPRATAAVMAWYSVLIEQLVGQLALGQSAAGVTHSFITGSRAGTFDYAGVDYAVIEFTVLVHLVEGINPVQ